jgi:transmembrane sensor
MAACAAMVMVTPPYGLWPSLEELGAGERTGVGERRTLRPMAAITVEMNACTALSLAQFGARLITGEAFVAVRGSPSPFSIVMGGETWSTRNAELNIRFSDRDTCITCLRGSVRQTGDQVRTLGANEQYVSKAGEAGQISPIDAQISAAWRRGVLIFRDTPLAEAIEAINRYRPGRIILANEQVGTRLVSGMFHTNQIENAVDQLQQLLSLKLTKMAGGVVILR